MASKEQIEYFLKNILKLEKWECVSKDHSRQKKLKFLKSITKAHIFTIYFQNITMTSTAIEKRRAPNLDDIISTALSGNGGVCIQLNYFLRLVLEYLGFEAFTVAADVGQSAISFSHCCTIVRLDENELYLVDVGLGNPNYEPIPLHQLPFRGMAAGYEYEFRRTPDGIYQRVQLNGSYTNGDFCDNKKEELRYSFILDPKKLEFFDSSMMDTFTNSNKSVFLKNAFLFRHFFDESSPNEDFILIWGTTVIIGGKNCRRVTTYNSYKELLPVLQKYFPRLVDESTMERAFNYWENIQEQK